eukprot:COSAG02_NODE_27852_length_601_cov_1.037849_1_plen_135_part_10
MTRYSNIPQTFWLPNARMTVLFSHYGASLNIFLAGLREQVVLSPVTTLDLAATFIVLAGGTVPSEMNSTSLLPLLKEPTAPPPRTVVHSGLANFRVVIKVFNQSMVRELQAPLGHSFCALCLKSWRHCLGGLFSY